MSPLSARIVTLEELFKLGRFTPAAVQRDYRWEQTHCDALLCDLLSAFEQSGLSSAEVLEPADPDIDENADDDDALGWMPNAAPEPQEPSYYLGAAMLSPTGRGDFLIYDGLQRLTTLTVLFACLRDFSDPPLADITPLLHESSGAPRLTIDFADHALSHDVQRAGATRARWPHAEGLTDAGRRLRAAIVLFRRQISRMSQDERSAFALFLRTRVLFSLIEITSARLAAQVFVTTNDRGLPLDRGDVLKGQVVDLVGKGHKGEAESLEIARLWAREAASAGDGFEPLLRAADFIARTRPQGADCLQRFFSDYIEPRLGPEGAAAWVRGPLREYAAALVTVRTHLGRDAASGIDAACRRLSLLPFGEWLPVALLFALRAKPARAERDLTDLARASVIVLLRGYSARDRATIYGRAVRQIRARRNPFNGALSFDAEARRSALQALENPFHEPEYRGAVVRWLESLMWGETLPASFASRAASVEHILPVRPPRGSQWLDIFPDEEERAALTNSIGNLALIPAEINEQLGNKDFETKRAVFADLRQNWRLLEGLQKQALWTPEALRARTQSLKTMAAQALGLV